jgi:hypothetical protein
MLLSRFVAQSFRPVPSARPVAYLPKKAKPGPNHRMLSRLSLKRGLEGGFSGRTKVLSLFFVARRQTFLSNLTEAFWMGEHMHGSATCRKLLWLS